MAALRLRSGGLQHAEGAATKQQPSQTCLLLHVVSLQFTIACAPSPALQDWKNLLERLKPKLGGLDPRWVVGRGCQRRRCSACSSCCRRGLLFLALCDNLSSQPCSSSAPTLPRSATSPRLISTWVGRCTTSRWSCCCGPRTVASCWHAPYGEVDRRWAHVGLPACSAATCHLRPGAGRSTAASARQARMPATWPRLLSNPAALPAPAAA